MTSCDSSFNNKRTLDKNDIDYIEICKQFDTVSLRLTNDQVADFIDHWNNSRPKGLYKYLPEYSLAIHFKADSLLSYRTNNDLIKQRREWAYSVGDKEYFKNIWFKQAGLTYQYFEYYPTYEKEGKFYKGRNPPNKEHCEAIKQVLTYYKHKWKDIRGQIFYEGKIDDELLWNYTTKANDRIWLSSHR
ncbi:MAG: hypothetical protein EOP48_19925 [Sphingobacteriales bacterium]|nr:MAG: hypothetical protein EOP48_19925 [Sphingobacteriales bacterium]